MAGSAWRHICRQKPGHAGRTRNRELRSQGEPCRAAGVAAGSGRRAGQSERATTTSSGVGLIRPLERYREKIGCSDPLAAQDGQHHPGKSKLGKSSGNCCDESRQDCNIRARKGVIIGTGGHSSNVNFSQNFRSRLTEEYQVAGEPYSFQDASGEIAAMAIGASLWGAYNQSGEFGQNVTKAGWIGCQYGYVNLSWQPDSPIFSQARATGLSVKDYQNAILVNMAGLRFYDEDARPISGEQLQFHQVLHPAQLS